LCKLSLSRASGFINRQTDRRPRHSDPIKYEKDMSAPGAPSHQKLG
jgi:hypothetical protein